MTYFLFPFGVGQVFFSKLLLENIKPGAFFEWCKINRGAFVVARYVYGSFYLPSHPVTFTSPWLIAHHRINSTRSSTRTSVLLIDM